MLRAASLKKLPLIQPAYEGQPVAEQIYDAAYMWALPKYGKDCAKEVAAKTRAKYLKETQGQ